jgi:hypothetical protein
MVHYMPQHLVPSDSDSLLGIGEAIRGLAIDIADFGKGSGKEIEDDGKAEVKQGVRKVEESLHR